MRGFVTEEPRELQSTPCPSDGIAMYLYTMFAVAHCAGASHWCTPGHNRGKASEALALGALRPVVVSIPLPLRRSARLVKIDG